MDRWGVRTVLLPIVVLCAASVALIALTPNSVVAFMLFFAITGVLGSGQGPLGYAKAVSAWFDDRRGLALGITMSGIRAGSGPGAPVHPVSDRQFWLACRRCRSRPAHAARGVPGGVSVHSRTAKATNAAGANTRNRLLPRDRPPDLEVREALGGRRFWLIACALLLVSTVTQGMVVHTVPLLTDKGIRPRRRRH